MMRTTLAGVVFVTLSVTFTAQTQNWSQWRGARRDGVAAFATPAAWPEKPPIGWWIITLPWGRIARDRASPPARMTAAADAAIPIQVVCTSGLMCCIES